MARRKIENIKIGEFAPGTAFGAYVYNVSINVGINGEPSTCEVDLINESGVYNINTRALNATAPRSIKFGNLLSPHPKDFVFLKSMFLVNFSYDQSVGTKTLRLKFVDGATVLNKIQVLLLNKQATPNNILGPYRGVWDQALRTYSLPIQCANKCMETQAPPWGVNSRNPWPTGSEKAFGYVKGAGRSGKAVVVIRRPSRAVVTNVNPTDLANGGVIIIGEEDFVQSDCQVPNITYTFADLLNVIQNFLGIRVIGLSDRGLPLRETFTGSLKEVLNSWCALYGYSFTWDHGTDSIVGLDLQAPKLGSLEPIYQLVNATKEGSTLTPVAISDVNRNFSIENTYRQDHLSSYVKPSKTGSSKSQITKRIHFRPFHIFNIIPEATFERHSGGRTPGELIISAVLSKYNPNARTLYNYYLIAKKTNGFTQDVLKYGSPIGLSIRAQLNATEKAQIFTYTMSIKEGVENTKQFGKGSAVCLGTYSKELEQRWTDWEKKIADFIGKYYYYPRSLKDDFICDKTRQTKYIKKVTTKPPSKEYSGAVNIADPTEDFPFNELLLHPNGVSQMDLVDDWGNAMEDFYLIDRNPSYGQKDENVRELFYNKGEEVLKDFMPSYSTLDGNQQMYLDELIKRVFPSIWSTLSSIKDENKKPMLIFLPDMPTIESVLAVGGLNGIAGWKWSFNPPLGMGRNIYSCATGNMVNKREYKPKQDAKDPHDCKLNCVEDLVSWLCECPPGEQYDPNKVGLTNKCAQWFALSLNHGKAGGWKTEHIILPSEYPYAGYVDVVQEWGKTYGAIMQHFGALTNAQGTMGYKINLTNITSDIDAHDDAGKAGVPVANGQESGQIVSHVMVPGKGRIAAGTWHGMTDTQHNHAMPTETLSFTMVGLDFGAFYNYITIPNGLRSLSISLGEDGTKVSVSLSTSPPVLPQMDKLLPRVEARVNSNAFIRTY
jgi:hypothetical protein